MDLATMKHATSWFIVLVVGTASVALIIWTVMAGQVAKRSTVSSVILDTWKEYPVLPLIVGLIFGMLFAHWGWPQKR